MLYVFEGIDGCGKSTAASRVKELLEKRGMPVALFREPTEGEWGRKMRAVFESGVRLSPDEEARHFTEDRKENVEKNIAPALREGKIVLLDRYYFSTAAYQGAAGLDWRRIVEDNEAFAVQPDIVFFLLIRPRKALKRIELEGRKKTAPEKLESLERINAVYREMFDELKKERGYLIVELSAEARAEAVAKYIEEAVASHAAWKTDHPHTVQTLRDLLIFLAKNHPYPADIFVEDISGRAARLGYEACISNINKFIRDELDL